MHAAHLVDQSLQIDVVECKRAQEKMPIRRQYQQAARLTELSVPASLPVETEGRRWAAPCSPLSPEDIGKSSSAADADACGSESAVKDSSSSMFFLRRCGSRPDSQHTFSSQPLGWGLTTDTAWRKGPSHLFLKTPYSGFLSAERLSQAAVW